MDAELGMLEVWSVASTQPLICWQITSPLLEQPDSFFQAQFSLGFGGAAPGTVGMAGT